MRADAAEIVFVRGTTEAINLVAAELRPHAPEAGRRGARHRDGAPLQHRALADALRSRRARRCAVVPIDERGELRPGRASSACSSRARRLVAIAHVSNALGTVNPVREIIAPWPTRTACRCWSTARRRRRTCRVDVQALDCDFYVFSGHKLYGPTGIGVLYGKARAARGDAALPGRRRHDPLGDASRSTAGHDLPYKFEAGTPNIAGAIGLGAAIDYVDAHRPRARSPPTSTQLLDYATDALSANPGAAARRHGARARRRSCPSCSTASTRTTSGTILDREGVAIRTGHHCAQPLMERFGVPATARASFGLLQEPGGRRRLDGRHSQSA